MNAAASGFSRRFLFGYSVGSLGTGVFTTVPSVLLLYFMTSVLGVKAALAAIAVSLPKLLDLVIDPLIGAASDRTKTRWGRRRPFLFVGALALGASFVMLFAVPSFAAPLASFWYVMIVFTLSAAAYSVFAVPYIAMPAEMSDDPDIRTTIVSWRMAFALLGILVGSAAVPPLVSVLGGGRVGYASMSLIIGVFCAVVMLASFFATRDAPTTSTRPVERAAPSWREFLANRPYIVLLAVYVIQLTGIGAFSAVAPYLVVYELGRSDAYVGLIFLCLVGAAALSTLVWPGIARRLGKRRAYGAAALLYALANLVLLYRCEHAAATFVPIALMGVGFGGMQVLPFSMLTDAIQTESERTGAGREGFFTGVWTAGEKAGLAFGPLVAGLLLGLFGFVESTGESVRQPANALLGIRLIASVVPAVLLLSSLALLRLYSLNDERKLAPAPTVEA